MIQVIFYKRLHNISTSVLYTLLINLHKAVRSKGVILWDAAEADIIQMEMMAITTAMEAEASIFAT